MDYQKMRDDFMRIALPLICTGVAAGLTYVANNFKGYNKNEVDQDDHKDLEGK